MHEKYNDLLSTLKLFEKAWERYTALYNGHIPRYYQPFITHLIGFLEAHNLLLVIDIECLENQDTVAGKENNWFFSFKNRKGEFIYPINYIRTIYGSKESATLAGVIKGFKLLENDFIAISFSII